MFKKNLKLVSLFLVCANIFMLNSKAMEKDEKKDSIIEQNLNQENQYYKEILSSINNLKEFLEDATTIYDNIKSRKIENFQESTKKLEKYMSFLERNISSTKKKINFEKLPKEYSEVIKTDIKNLENEYIELKNNFNNFKQKNNLSKNTLEKQGNIPEQEILKNKDEFIKKLHNDICYTIKFIKNFKCFCEDVSNRLKSSKTLSCINLCIHIKNIAIEILNQILEKIDNDYKKLSKIAEEKEFSLTKKNYLELKEEFENLNSEKNTIATNTIKSIEYAIKSIEYRDDFSKLTPEEIYTFLDEQSTNLIKSTKIFTKMLRKYKQENTEKCYNLKDLSGDIIQQLKDNCKEILNYILISDELQQNYFSKQKQKEYPKELNDLIDKNSYIVNEFKILFLIISNLDEKFLKRILHSFISPIESKIVSLNKLVIPKILIVTNSTEEEKQPKIKEIITNLIEENLTEEEKQPEIKEIITNLIECNKNEIRNRIEDKKIEKNFKKIGLKSELNEKYQKILINILKNRDENISHIEKLINHLTGTIGDINKEYWKIMSGNFKNLQNNKEQFNYQILIFKKLISKIKSQYKCLKKLENYSKELENNLKNEEKIQENINIYDAYIQDFNKIKQSVISLDKYYKNIIPGIETMEKKVEEISGNSQFPEYKILQIDLTDLYKIIFSLKDESKIIKEISTNIEKLKSTITTFQNDMKEIEKIHLEIMTENTENLKEKISKFKYQIEFIMPWFEDIEKFYKNLKIIKKTIGENIEKEQFKNIKDNIEQPIKDAEKIISNYTLIKDKLNNMEKDVNKKSTEPNQQNNKI